MSSDRTGRLPLYLEQVATYCRDAEDCVRGSNVETYEAIQDLQFKTERCVQKVGEVVRRIGQERFESLFSSVAYQELVGVRNWIIHQYDDIDHAIVFEAATVHGPRLREEALALLAKVTQTEPIVPQMTLDAATGRPDALHDALADTGFVVVTDHGIDLSRLHDAYAAVEAFFALPEAEKRAYVVGVDGQRGYTPFGREHAKDADAPDLKEFWHVGRDAIAPNVWPERPEAFEREVAWLYEALDGLGLKLLRALTGPLGVAEDTFERVAAGGNSVLRLLHYPPLAGDADPRSVRAAAHEDVNLITLLVSASAAGLELKDREGRWRAIDAPPDSVIVDAGDMLARITNGALPSTTHRVVNPEGPNTSRYSMPFFLHPRPDAVLSVLGPYKDGTEPGDVAAGDFLRERLAQIGLK